jgi:hypothetical protein
MKNYLCKTKGGQFFVYTTDRDVSQYLGKPVYFGYGGPMFKYVSEIDVLDYKGVLKLPEEQAA